MRNGISGKAAVVAAFLFSSGLAASTAVASINVSPVRVYLAADNPREVVGVTNQEDMPKSYQVEVVRWTQTPGQPETYAPTDAVLAVPPLFTLEPGEKQVIRIGVLDAPDPETEQAFRMFITEIASPKTGDEPSGGIAMRLQIGIPVFVRPLAPAKTALAVVDSAAEDGRLLLELRNDGNRHVKVLETSHLADGADEVVTSRTVVYLLAGQVATVPVALSGGEPTGMVSVVTEGQGTLEYELPASP